MFGEEQDNEQSSQYYGTITKERIGLDRYHWTDTNGQISRDALNLDYRFKMHLDGIFSGLCTVKAKEEMIKYI